MENTHLPVVQDGGDGPAKIERPGCHPTTLAELGATLPVGIPGADGSLSKGFELKPWRTKEERELAKQKRQDTTIAQYVSVVVGAMCSRIGPHDMEAMKPAERSVVIAQMFMGDVFYVYCYLRRRAMGDDLRLEFQCETCARKIPYVASLDTLKVVTVDSLDALKWHYDLQTPIKVRRNEVKRLNMSAMRWAVAEQTAAVNFGTDAVAKIAAIKGSVVGVDDTGEQILVSDVELDELEKYDLEALADQINNHYVGPDMSIEDECRPEFCPRGGGIKFRVGIDWAYDSFFGISSR